MNVTLSHIGQVWLYLIWHFSVAIRVLALLYPLSFISSSNGELSCIVILFIMCTGSEHRMVKCKYKHLQDLFFSQNGNHIQICASKNWITHSLIATSNIICRNQRDQTEITFHTSMSETVHIVLWFPHHHAINYAANLTGYSLNYHQITVRMVFSIESFHLTTWYRERYRILLLF